MKGTPQNISTDETKYGLIKKSYDVLSMSRIYRKTPKCEKVFLALFLVELLRTEQCKTIYKIDHGSSVKIQVQCHRCQQLDQMQARCFNVPRCIQCGQSHLSSICLTIRLTHTTCANCNEKHLIKMFLLRNFPRKT